MILELQVRRQEPIVGGKATPPFNSFRVIRFSPVYMVMLDNGNASEDFAKAFMFTQRPWPEQSFGHPDRSHAAPEKPSKHLHSPVSRSQSPLQICIIEDFNVPYSLQAFSVIEHFAAFLFRLISVFY